MKNDSEKRGKELDLTITTLTLLIVMSADVIDSDNSGDALMVDHWGDDNHIAKRCSNGGCRNARHSQR